MDRENQFLELLREDQGRWRAIARFYAGQDFEDLLQEIQLQIWRSLAGFRGESSGRTWCYRIALNTAMNWKRSTKTRRERIPTQQGYNPGALPSTTTGADATTDPHNLVERLLAEQSPADRAILILLLDDVSYAEMAEILGISEGTLRVRIHRMKQRLRQHFGEVSDDL